MLLPKFKNQNFKITKIETAKIKVSSYITKNLTAIETGVKVNTNERFRNGTPNGENQNRMQS